MSAVSGGKGVTPVLLLGLGFLAALLTATPPGSIVDELLTRKMGFSSADLLTLD